MTLATQADVEKMLQIDFGADPDATVAQYLAQADDAIANYCGQDLNYATGIVETFENDGEDSPFHLVKRFPVSAVASVVEDDVTLTLTDEYVWYSDGRLRRVAGQFDWRWSEYTNAVVVTYSAGYGGAAPAPYDSVPDDLIMVAAAYASALFRQGAAFASTGVEGPVKSVSLDGSDSITYDTAAANEFAMMAGVPAFTEGHKMILAKYRRVTM